jgi:hypothetical protein
MPAVCEVEDCEAIVVGEDAWCGWCRLVRCRGHYDAAEHVCRYTGLVSLSPSISSYMLTDIGEEPKEERKSTIIPYMYIVK